MLRTTQLKSFGKHIKLQINKHLQYSKTAISLVIIPPIYSIAITTYKSQLPHKVAVQMILSKRNPNLMWYIWLTLSCIKSTRGNMQCVAKMPKSSKDIR
jgi:hypothetical protein